MMGRTHAIAGAVCWLAVARAASLPVDLLHLGVAMGAALLPDIDHPGSMLGKRILPLSVAISAVFGHRGITHSLLAVVLLIIATVFYGGHALVAAVTVGYVSHLLMDWLTPAGIPLLYPSGRSFHSPVTLPTGSLREFVAGLLMAGLAMALWGGM